MRTQNLSIFRFFLAVLCLTITAQTVSAELLYVQSEKAKLLTEPSFKGQPVLEVLRGTELQLLTKNNAWMQVSSGSTTGWISSMLVADKPPIAKITHIGSDDSAVTGEVRVRASAVATAGATRGLTAEEADENLNSDYNELQKMEELEISPEEVDEFSETIK